MTLPNRVFLVSAYLLYISHVALALWPMPRSLQTGTTYVTLASDFRVEIHGSTNFPQDLMQAISRSSERLRSDKLQRLVVGRGSSDRSHLASAPVLAKLILEHTSTATAPASIMQEITKDIASRSEVYSLTIPSTNSGSAVISSNSSLGLFRGLTTFEQLFYDDGQGVVYTYQAPVQITNDSPAFVSSVT